ncbi:transposase [Geobacter sp. AOG2]|uniref:helix-turn-helix domain-containing protein n=1 Tax=Geobacter sp. AOG2 TaxID=1566347 RepID=UPI001CC80ACA|nr:transposase [Geobacter sp. AOG2]GFE60584.1 hypothetical protein AOG2_11720 [Geobacter sp. AOG2]
MKKRDGRKLSADDQYKRRIKIVELRDSGMPNVEIARQVGCNLSHISTIWKRYQEGGLSEIESGIRGRKNGENRVLSPEEDAEIRNLIIKYTPDQLGLDYYLWSRDAVQLIVKEKYKIDMPLRTITDYIKRWRFTTQKPPKEAEKLPKCPFKNWLTKDYPKLVAKTEKEKYDINWVNSSNIKNKYKSNYSKVNISMLSSISNQGKIRFMIYKDEITSSKFTKFIDNLIKESNKKIFIIFYNEEIYQSNSVHKWLDRRKKKIDVIYLEDCYFGLHS